MGLFGIDTKFVKLVAAIDERLKVYELLSQGDPDHIPPGIKTLAQEFRNLKIRAWDIQTGKNDAVKYVKELHVEDIKAQIEKNGDME